MGTQHETFRRHATEELTREPSRRVLLRKGLLVGVGAAVAGIAAPVLLGTGTAQAYVSGLGEQSYWAWCDKCQGLFYGPFQSSSYCPALGQHDGSESYNYVIPYGTGSIGWQPDWAWCDKCQGMFYGPFQSSSYCPKGGQHDGSASYNYEMPYSPGGQSGWRWCDKCQGLFYGPFQSSSHCPEGGQHDGSESLDYNLGYFT
jgi:hypothetical protein